MRQSKQLMRQDLRYGTQIQPSLQPPDLRSLIPDRQLTDRLVTLYFSSFETTFRILHQVQFLKECDEYYQLVGMTRSPTPFSEEVFAAKLLALMACATCFASSQPANERPQFLDRTSKEWIQAVASWVKLLINSARLSLDILQVKCLLLLQPAQPLMAVIALGH